jgi:hypothetical protein
MARLWYIVRFVSLLCLIPLNSVASNALDDIKYGASYYASPISPHSGVPLVSPNPRMAFYRSDLAPSLKSSARPRRDILPESPRTVLNPGNACWSGLNPFCLGEGIKNGLRSALPTPTPELSPSSSRDSHESLPQATLDQLEQTFSPIGSSDSDARIYLTQTPFDVGPSTVVWNFPEPTWGQWPCHSFSYCISVMTERDANTVYVVDTPESEEPVPPVHECTSDGVIHLWLIVPNRPSADGMVQLSDEQMRAAVEFYDRSSLSSLNLGASAVTTTTTMKKDKVVDPYDSNRDDDDNARYRHYYADAREADAGAVLLSCADGNEVDVVALAVLLLTRHHLRLDSDSDSYSRGDHMGHHDRRYRHAAAARGLGARDIGFYTVYQASQVIDDDPRVSHVWKGLLRWPDVERVRAALVSCA